MFSLDVSHASRLKHHLDEKLDSDEGDFFAFHIPFFF